YFNAKCGLKTPAVLLKPEPGNKHICVSLHGAKITSLKMTILYSRSSFKNHCRCSSLCGAFMVYGAFISCLCCGCCLQVGNIGQANYAASKAGVEGLTRTAAKELSRFGIRCNCVLPGFITTPMTDKVPEKVISKIESLVPLGRMGEPAEVADVCAFLASDDSRYITGASIEVTGAVSL
uniref:Hydroxysteroid (17-beta) dehydrogenase 8 n=1 Tax=Haplochromis burtoni TaxID=8153 RepID=A0A3Q2VDQ8_HAPBU